MVLVFSSLTYSEKREKRKRRIQRRTSLARMREEVKFIGLTGTNGAGKGEVASFFQKRGYDYFSLSDLIREELEKEGKETSRDNMIQKGNQLREKHGSDILARRIMKKIKGKAVIDSIRNPKEVEFLKKQGGFVLLAVDAPVELRFERIKRRGREESASSLPQFIAKEAEEMSNRKKGQQLKSCIALADFKVENDDSLERLQQKLEIFI